MIPRMLNQRLFLLQVARPTAMKKEGIQTRKRKPKSGSTPKEPKQKHSGYSGEGSKPSKHQHQQQQQQQSQSDLYTISKIYFTPISSISLVSLKVYEI